MAAHPVLSEVDQVCKQLQEVINRRIAVALEKKKTGKAEAFINVHHGAVIPNPADYDEVFPQLYIGGEKIARDIPKLQKEGFTHIVNCAEGKKFSQVDTGAGFYNDTGIDYHGIPGHDSPKFDITPYFQTAADFINDGILKGKVYIHCHQGISRSTAVAIAYLMIHHKMTADKALDQILSHRLVMPNKGFLKRLAALDLQLNPSTTTNSHERSDELAMVESVLKTHLPRMSPYKITHTAICLFYTSLGFKPSYLYDQGPMDLELASRVLTDLEEIVSELFSTMVVVEFSMDILFVNVAALSSHLEEFPTECFINVSTDSSFTAKCDQWALVNDLRNLSLLWSDRQLSSFVLEMQEDWCGPSVLGLMLGFPAVYYLSSEEHRLNNVLLKVITTTVNFKDRNYEIDSFSLPMEVWDKLKPVCVRRQQRIEAKGSTWPVIVSQVEIDISSLAL